MLVLVRSNECNVTRETNTNKNSNCLYELKKLLRALFVHLFSILKLYFNLCNLKSYKE